MSIFKKIPKDNIVISPYTAHKKYTFLLSNYSASNNHIETAKVFGYDAIHAHAFLKDSTVARAKTVHQHIIRGDEFLSGSEALTTNNFVKRSVHDSLQHMYYRSVRDLSNTFCVEPTFNEFRELNSTAQVISIPGRLMGDMVKETDEFENSIKITSGTVEIRDDGVGNLYDINAGGFTDPLSVYRSTTSSLVFHCSFNEKYPYHQENVGPHCPAFSDILEDKSRYATDVRGHSMFFNTGSRSIHGTGVMLTGVKGGNIYDKTHYSYFRALKHPNIDFRKDEDFALSFWINLPTSQSDTGNRFNYVMSTGQGDHIDHAVGHRWTSKFPFDVVTYNQRNNPTDQSRIRLFNNLRPATGSIRIRTIATHSTADASAGPTQSAFFQLKDAFGTSVTFTVTTESGNFTSQATYPTISFHGAVTASGLAMAEACATRVNQGIINGFTASGNHFPLLISASYVDLPANPNMAAEVIFSASIRGTGNDSIPQGKTVGVFGADDINNNTFNIAGFSKLLGGTGTFSLASMMTSSYIIATTLGDTGGGQNAMETNHVGQTQTESFERHVFYWYSASNVPPQLGAYTTHSTTAIPLNEPTDFSSGSHDILSIASKSIQVIDAHPSFSYAKTGGEASVAAFRRYVGLLRTSTAVGYNNNLFSLLTANGFNSIHAESFGKFNDVNAGNAPNGNLVTSGSTTGVHQNPGVGGLVVPTTGTTTDSMTDLVTFEYNLISEGTVGKVGQLVGRRNDGVNLFRVSSSTAVTESWNHVVYQKSGSHLQLYVNNVKECEVVAKDEGQMKNEDDIYFGVAARMTQSGRFVRNDAGDIFINSRGNPKRELIKEFMRPLSGALDEIRIYDNHLNSDQIKLLYNCPNGTPYVGNAFYEHGILTITHQSNSYAGIAKHCTMSFKNTYEIKEHEYTLNIKRGEYNFTMNPSIVEKTATGSRERKVAPFVTNTDWDPYITTVGLYNEAGQLLVVGKLSRALRKEDGYDTTIVVRYDT